jgi:hypothetical protein
MTESEYFETEAQCELVECYLADNAPEEFKKFYMNEGDV